MRRSNFNRRNKWCVLSFLLTFVMILSLILMNGMSVYASETNKTIDVNETLKLSCISDTPTVRTKTSNATVATVSDISMSIVNGEWKCDFSVKGVSEGKAIITVYGVFNDVEYAKYIVTIKHDFDKGKITTIADCKTEGVKTYTCKGCGATKTENFGKDENNHVGNKVMKGVKEANCGDGYTGDLVCSACGYVYSKGVVIPATSNTHSIVIDEKVEPTCTESGLTQGAHCSVCGYVSVAQAVIPAKGHTEVIDEGVPATKTSAGLTEGSHCSVCNAVIVKQNVIPKLAGYLSHGVVDKNTEVNDHLVIDGDLYVKKGVTLTVTGSLTIRGNLYVFGTLNNEGSLTVENSAYVLHYNNMLSAGNYDYGYLYNSGKIKIDTLTVKDTYLNVIVPMVIHVWVITEKGEKPTCISDGTNVEECSVCGEEKITSIKATGHDMTEVLSEKIAATCENDGKEKLMGCKNCDKTEGGNVIPAIGHKWDNGTITKLATVSTEGLKTYKCIICGTSKTEVIEKLKETAEEDKITEDKTTEDKATEDKATEQKRTEQKVTKQSVTLKKQKILSIGVKKYKAKNLKKKKIIFALNAKTTGNGKITYKITNGNKKCITVSKKGKVTLKKGCKKGTYKIMITASKTKKFEKATKVVVVKVK